MFQRLWYWLTNQDKIDAAFQAGLDIGTQAGKFIADYATKVIPFHQKAEYYNKGFNFGKKVGYQRGVEDGIQIGMETMEKLRQLNELVGVMAREIIPTEEHNLDNPNTVLSVEETVEEVVQQNKVARVGVLTAEDMEALQNGDSSVLRIIRSGGRK